MRGDGTFAPVSATEQRRLILVAALIIPYHWTSNRTGSKDPRPPHAALAPAHDHLSQGFSWAGLEEFGETLFSAFFLNGTTACVLYVLSSPSLRKPADNGKTDMQ